MRNSKNSDDAKSQYQRFVEAAKGLGADDHEAHFNNVLRRFGKASRTANKPKGEKPKTREPGQWAGLLIPGIIRCVAAKTS